MSAGVPADEVAEDYKASLEYLTSNDRYAINNLTVIAKENTEHAEAISKVLEEHIRKAPPNQKLYALYVLDSIAKNIGTPYTLFLGHNLYKTFMGAYTLVDSNIRKKLDDILKTWKNPVPGSSDTRPVFPVDITRSIEKALIQAKTVAIQQGREQQKSQHELLRRAGVSTTPVTTWRNTPPPPQNGTLYPPPVPQGYPPNIPPNMAPNGRYETQSPYPPSYNQYMPPQPTSLQYQHLPPALPPQPVQSLPPPEITSLEHDIEKLIPKFKTLFAQDPYDATVQSQLKALLDLQSVLQTRRVTPDELKAIRGQITHLTHQHHQNNSLQPPKISPAPAAVVAPPSHPPPVHVSYQAQPIVPTMSTMPSTTSLAELLASVQRSKQASVPIPNPSAQTPQPTPQDPRTYHTRPNPLPNPSAGAENPLLASLRAAGLIVPGGSTPVNGSVTPTSFPPRPSTISTPPVQFANLIPSSHQQPHASSSKNGVELTSASLKIPRTYLISKLYEALPNQCSTCGKRFPLTEAGRARKARHLDWHFRTNQRIADSSQRGHSRSWYLDELEWIKYRDNEENMEDTANGGKDPKALAAAAAVKNDPKNKFISVPSDSILASLPCPICQEKFVPSWNDDVQDWVWMDALQIGSKVYHASCYSELQKDGANTPRIATPDSVLGKRKAEAANSNPIPTKKKELSPKIKKELPIAS